MDKIQKFKIISPWITENYDVENYFKEYNEVLDAANGGKPHNSEFDYEESMLSFFYKPDDLDSNSVYLGASSSSAGGSTQCNSQTGMLCDDSLKLGSLDKMEADCSVDLLTCDQELPPRELSEGHQMRETGRVTNWYAGTYMDGVIPDHGPAKLATLAAQAKELYNRETIRDYIRLRHRLLKYSRTMRMIMKKENTPEEVKLHDGLTSPCLRETLFNVRIYRPFYKRTKAIKGHSRFPRHSQELLFLGSQKLSDLRDALVCMNDHFICVDMSENPDLSMLPDSSLFSDNSKFKIQFDHYKDSKQLFPSSFFCFNNVCYPDLRNPLSKDISENVKKWAKKYPTIGEIKTVKMEDAKFSDLNIRLGYPYLFQHLGNCEHLIVISDIRLLCRSDIQNPSRYPLSRGNPMKFNVKCYSCNLRLAKWLVKDDPRLPQFFVHFCDKCLKEFSYNEKGEKLSNFKLYPFIDEFAAQIILDSKKKSSNGN